MFITLAVGTDPTNVYKIISIVGYSLAAVCLVAGIALFFLYDIKGVYAFLTGRKKQQGISEMRKQQGEGEGKPAVSPSIKFGFTSAPQDTGAKKLNKKSIPLQSQPQAQPQPVSAMGETAPIGQDSVREGTEVQPPVDEGTEVLSPADSADEGTEVLSPSMYADEGTQVLSSAAEPQQNDAVDVARKVEYAKNEHVGTFVLVKNEMVIHSDQVL
ncbi:MAG: hypothetical protein IJI67_01320 [Clostridia bacterium]|nr:hypothetical protein [Clostridia bacterium]